MEYSVITGLGAVSPFGSGVTALYENLIQANSGVKELVGLDVRQCTTTKGAQNVTFDPEQFDSSSAFCRLGRATQFAIIASEEALQESETQMSEVAADRVGLIYSSARSSLEKTETFYENLLAKGPRFLNPLMFQESVNNAPISHISLRYGITGPTLAITSGETGIVQAVLMADWWLKQSIVDRVLVVASEAINKISTLAYSHAGGLAPVSNKLTECSKPYDVTGNGFVFGEGALAFVMELGSCAKKRGASEKCRILGGGLSHDSSGVGRYGKGGGSLAKAIELALAKARVNASDIQCVYGAANSSLKGDHSEVLALNQIFGKIRPKVLLSSIKSMIGELEGAATAFSISAAILSLTENMVLPTINTSKPFEDMQLNLVRDSVYQAKTDLVLVNSMSFGGASGALIFG